MSARLRVSFLACALVLAAPPLFTTSTPALAGDNTLAGQVNSARAQVSTIFIQVRRGVLYICGIVIFACGVAGLTGRMPWKWFWTVGGCMFLIGVAFVVLDQILAEDVAPDSTGLKTSIFGAM